MQRAPLHQMRVRETPRRKLVTRPLVRVLARRRTRQPRPVRVAQFAQNLHHPAVVFRRIKHPADRRRIPHRDHRHRRLATIHHRIRTSRPARRAPDPAAHQHSSKQRAAHHRHGNGRTPTQTKHMQHTNPLRRHSRATGNPGASGTNSARGSIQRQTLRPPDRSKALKLDRPLHNALGRFRSYQSSILIELRRLFLLR